MGTYRIKDLFRDAADLVLAGFLFLAATALSGGLCAGAALKALFRVAFRVVDGKKTVRVVHDFWDGFKEGFWFSTILWVLAAVLGFGEYLVIRYAMSIGEPVVAGAGVVSAVLLVSYVAFLYPMLAVFETNRKRDMLRNVLLMAASHPLSVLLVLGALAVPVLLFFLWYGTILVSVALYAAIATFHLQKLFAPYVGAFVPDETDAE